MAVPARIVGQWELLAEKVAAKEAGREDEKPKTGRRPGLTDSIIDGNRSCTCVRGRKH
jgi:hypothetical protein